MTQLVRFRIDETDDVVVEVDGDGDESVLVSGGGAVADATGAFTEKLASVRKAISVTLEELGNALGPDSLKITFGVKLTAEAGAVIAKSAVEGNLQVEMEWKRGDPEE